MFLGRSIIIFYYMGDFMEPVTLQAEQPVKPLIGQRLAWSFDIVKAFKHKQEDGTEVDLQRVYQLVLPYGAPFEEIYTVINELKEELQAIEIKTKEQAAKLAAEAEAKQAEADVAEVAAN